MPLRIAGEQIAGYPVLARVLAGADQILIQHFAQVRLQLREAVAVRQADALLDAQVIELLRDRIRPPSTQLPLRVPISLYAGSTVVQALSNSAKGKTAAIVFVFILLPYVKVSTMKTDSLQYKCVLALHSYCVPLIKRT